MMRSPINFSDWVPGEGSFATQEPGAFTGFGTFSTDPSTGGVMDSRGTFNPAFNGQTPSPRFEAETDVYRAALPALARKARMGDPTAVIAYQKFYGDLSSRKKLYDLAYSTGLNDKNSADIMNNVLSTVTDDKFGGVAGQFRTRRVRYLASQAQQRGVNAEDLFASEQDLDDTFRQSFLSSLSSATGITRAGELKARFAESEGMMANAGQFLKEGLARWEAKNGLRDDKTRTAMMGYMSEYLAKCEANPGLRPLSGDAYAMAEAAAQAASGTGGRSRFDDYTRAVESLDRGFISYTGHADGDHAAGYANVGDRDGRTSAYWAIRDAYAKAYGRNVANGGKARDFTTESRKELVRDLVANLGEVSPRAAAMDGYGEMIESFANDIVSAGEKGGIDLNSLSMKYYKGFKAPERPKTAEGRGFRDDLTGFARDMVTWGIDERPYLRAKIGGTMTTMDGRIVPTFNAVEDQYSESGVKGHVREALDRLLAQKRFDSIRGDREFLDSFEDMVSSYILNANNKADPGAAGSGNVAEYMQGMVDRVNLLYMADEAKRRGVDLTGWAPKTTGYDYEVRGNTEQNLKGMYGDLSDRIGKTLALVPDTTQFADDDAGFKGRHDYHFLKNLKSGLDFLMKSGGDLDPETDEGKKAIAYRKLFEEYAGYDMSAARAAADGAVDIRLGELYKGSAAPTMGCEKEAAALAALTEDMFSDVSNPVLSERAKRFAAIKLGGADFRNLDQQTRKNLADQYHTGVMTLMKQIMRQKPEIPMSVWADDDSLFKQLDTLSNPLFERAARMSDAIGIAKEQEDRRRMMLQVEGAVERDKKIKENE